MTRMDLLTCPKKLCRAPTWELGANLGHWYVCVVLEDCCFYKLYIFYGKCLITKKELNVWKVLECLPFIQRDWIMVPSTVKPRLITWCRAMYTRSLYFYFKQMMKGLKQQNARPSKYSGLRFTRNIMLALAGQQCNAVALHCLKTPANQCHAFSLFDLSDSGLKQSNKICWSEEKAIHAFCWIFLTLLSLFGITLFWLLRESGCCQEARGPDWIILLIMPNQSTSSDYRRALRRSRCQVKRHVKGLIRLNHISLQLFSREARRLDNSDSLSPQALTWDNHHAKVEWRLEWRVAGMAKAWFITSNTTSYNDTTKPCSQPGSRV